VQVWHAVVVLVVAALAVGLGVAVRTRRAGRRPATLSRAERDHQLMLRDARRRVEVASRPARLAQVGPVTLTELDLTVSGRTLPLTRTLQLAVEVDPQGRRVTFRAQDREVAADCALPYEDRYAAQALIDRARFVAQHVDKAREQIAVRARVARAHLARLEPSAQPLPVREQVDA
jgi:hypothetical protein